MKTNKTEERAILTPDQELARELLEQHLAQSQLEDEIAEDWGDDE